MAAVIQNIVVSTRNTLRLFSFTRPNIGDNAIATVKDLNDLALQFNATIGYRPYIISATQTQSNAPTYTILNNGRFYSSTGPDDCSPCAANPPKCTGCGPATYSPLINRSILTGISRIAAGHYKVTLNETIDSIKNMVDISVICETANFKGGSPSIINIDKHLDANPPYIDIFTFSGITPTDGILTNTAIEFRVF